MLLVEDRALLEGFRAGRREALLRVYRHYQPRIASFLRGGFSFRSGDRVLRFGGYSSPWEREVSAHETLSRAFLPSARLAYDGLRPFTDYVLTIARNHVINELRRHEHLVLVGAPEDLEGPAVDAAPRVHDSTIEEREVERLLSAFLAEASPVEKKLYELRFTDELGQVEAATALGLTRIQVRRAEAKLKRRLLGYLKKNGYLSAASDDVVGSALRSVLW